MSRRASGRITLRKWREAQSPKVTQADLGRDVGVSGDYIRRYELGKQDLPLPLKLKLSRRTGIPLNVLLSAKQLRTAHEAQALMERDAGNGAAA
jgi:hypothetical protein